MKISFSDLGLYLVEETPMVAVNLFNASHYPLLSLGYSFRDVCPLAEVSK